MRAVIFAGGTYGSPEFYKNELKADDFIIAADGGAAFARKIGAEIDVAIGDFDTLSSEKISTGEIIKLNFEKDYTDSFEALFLAKKRGFTEAVMFGGTGSRMDHSLANIFLLKKARDIGVELSLCDENNIIYLTESEITIKKREGYHLSVVQLTDVTGLSLSGLYYPLNDKSLALGDMLGISNEFTADFACVCVKSGAVLVMLTRD